MMGLKDDEKSSLISNDRPNQATVVSEAVLYEELATPHDNA
jgi:hypothetical protein